mmetsp:Transcript_17074/g.34376  ORF Transcript_17074/g.34376 Transcript_17074/m.34376 type:complete len:284 (+) Transcript_17074:67-918(+)
MPASNKAEPSPEDFAKQFHAENLTSSVYGPNNPPKDWADASLLIPHETIRREMDSMQKSVRKLVSRMDDKSYQGWQAIYFCEWYVDIFEPFVRMHHDIEEEIFFPWLAEKATLPTKKYGKSHEELLDMLKNIGVVCVAIINKKGKNCENYIRDLAMQADKLVPELRVHLQEEEEEIPALEREHYTKADEEMVVKKIIARAPFSELREVFPAILEGISEWGTEAYRDDLLRQLPAPLRYLMLHYFVPDYESSIKPKRDAPFLDAKPTLTRKRCCGIFFCCACII